MPGLGAERYDWRLGPVEFLAGLALLAVILAGAGLVAIAARRRLLPGWEGPPARLAELVIGTVTLVLVAEILGTVGAFQALPFCLTVGLAGAVAVWDLRRAVPSVPPQGLPPRVGGNLVTGLAFLVAGLVCLRFGWATAGGYDSGMSGFDTQWYHGPLTALFLQTGSTIELHNTIAPQYLSWFYPHTSELLHSVAILPFDRDLLSPGLNLVWLLGSMLAAWCIGRPFGMAPLSLIAACVILGSGLLADQAGEMRNDLPAVCFVLAAAALAITAWRRAAASAGGDESTPVPNAALLVIGAAAGLAAGTKLNYLATAGALVVALAWALPAGRRLRGLGLLVGAAFLTGGYWYLRNLLASGNPLPWVTSAGPLELPGPAQEIGGRESHGVIEYLADSQVWADWFLPGFRDTLTLAWPLVLAAAILAVVGLIRANELGRRLSWAMAATIGATIGAWLLAPASAEGPAGEPVGFESGLRYLAPALALALATLPVGLVRPGGARDLNLAQGPSPGRKPGWAGLAAAALAVLVAAGLYPLQRHYLEQRYAEPDFTTPGLERAFAEAAAARPAADASGLATSATRIYPFFGADLARPVRYLGLPEPEGGFRRPEGCAEWRQAVNLARPGFVVTAWDRLAPHQPPLPPEAGWIGTDPAAQRLWATGGAAAFRITGLLDPTTCRSREA